MKRNVNSIVRAFSETFPVKEPVIEIGSFQILRQLNIANLRPYFKGKEFIGCDMRRGRGVDRIENVENLTFKDSSVGTVLMLETLEHVQNCHKAVDEVYRVLKKGGIVLMSSPMDFPIHNHPYDYWRFTPEAFNLLLKKFDVKIIGYEGNPKKPHTVFVIGIKNTKSGFKKEFQNFKKKYLNLTKNYRWRLKVYNTLVNGWTLLWGFIGKTNQITIEYKK